MPQGATIDLEKRLQRLESLLVESPGRVEVAEVASIKSQSPVVVSETGHAPEITDSKAQAGKRPDAGFMAEGRHYGRSAFRYTASNAELQIDQFVNTRAAWESGDVVINCSYRQSCGGLTCRRH